MLSLILVESSSRIYELMSVFLILTRGTLNFIFQVLVWSCFLWLKILLLKNCEPICIVDKTRRLAIIEVYLFFFISKLDDIWYDTSLVIKLLKFCLFTIIRVRSDYNINNFNRLFFSFRFSLWPFSLLYFFLLKISSFDNFWLKLVFNEAFILWAYLCQNTVIQPLIFKPVTSRRRI